MPWPIPSFAETRDFLIAAFSSRFPNKNVNKHGGIYKRQSVVALGLTDAHYHIRQVGKDVMPDTADTFEMQDRHLGIWGVDRKGAVGASRSLALRVFGTVAAPVPAFEPMVHVASGLTYETRSGGVIGAAGHLDVDVAAISTGEVTNLEAGEQLQFSATPPGLKANARITLELKNGIDQEGVPDAGDRLLARIRKRGGGGNRDDFEAFVLEAADYVATAYVYPHRHGAGSVDLAALKKGSGSARLLDASERQEVFDHVNPIRLVTGTPRVLEVTILDVDLDLVILPEADPAYAFDWSDATPPVVSGYVSATRTVTFADDRPVDMAVGDRISFEDPLLLGKQYVIESLSGTDAVVLTEDAGAIAAGNAYAGGPLVEPIQARAQALFDALGPSNPDSKSYGNWESNLRHSNLFERVQTTEGVLDSQIIAPAGPVVEPDDPAWPADTTVELLALRRNLVRSYVSAGQ